MTETTAAAAARSASVAAAVRAEARDRYAESVAAEMPLSGKALGEMFGRGERWGRRVIADYRAEPDTDRPKTGTPQVSEVASDTADIGRTVERTPVVPVQTADSPAGQAVRAADMERSDGMDRGQPRGARLVVWSGFLLGIAASIAANVAHAEPAVGPRLAGAFVPVALLLAVEAMSRPQWRRTGVRWGLVRYGGTGLVATVAAVMSYRHMVGLLERYGEDALNAHLGPLAVDGLMVVCGFALLAINDKEGQSK